MTPPRHETHSDLSQGLETGWALEARLDFNSSGVPNAPLPRCILTISRNLRSPSRHYLCASSLTNPISVDDVAFNG